MKKRNHLSKKLCCIFCLTAMLLPQTVFAKTSTLQESDTLYHDLSYEDELEEAFTVLTLGDISNVTSSLVLPDSYGIHVNIAWSSSDETIIDLSGNVTTSEEKDADVTLTAKLSSTKTEQTKEKTFEVHVPKTSVNDILEQDAKEVREYVDYILNTGYKLPTSEDIGIRSQVAWKLSSGEAEITDGKLVKTEKSEERQPIILNATLSYKDTNKEIILENLTLLDEYEAYILSYFAGKEESKEMYIAYSYDGIHWMYLNHADAVLTPTMGKKQIRDPFIMRKKDGSFAIFATNGWTSPLITIWDSDNLTEFNNERLCQVSEKGGVASGYHAWAPECNYDPITDTYMVYWSDPKANDGIGQTYYNTSSDLLEFTEARVLFEREFRIIDASIKKYKGDYYMVYDDSTGDNDTGNGGRRIYLAKADSLKEGAFYPCNGVMSEGVAEGPFLLQNFENDNWYVYYDYYHKHKFGITTTENLAENEWNYEGICETMPWDEVRHGGGIAVTKKELDRILDKWCLDAPSVSEIIKPADVKIAKGAKLKDDTLIKSVEVLLRDGNIAELPVTWEIEDSDTSKLGSIKITGTFEDSDISFTNEKELIPEITLIVEKNAGSKIWIYTLVIVAVVALGGVIALRMIRRGSRK